MPLRPIPSPTNAMSTRRHVPPPRDYVDDPVKFGRAEQPRWAVPEGGSYPQMRIAQAQHLLAWIVYAHGNPNASRTIAARAGISVKTWSDYSLGKSWMRQDAVASAVLTLLGGEQLPNSLSRETAPESSRRP